MSLGKLRTAVLVVFGGAPLVVAVALTALRPDLMESFVDHPGAPTVVRGVLGVSGLMVTLLLVTFLLVDRFTSPLRTTLRRVLNGSAIAVVGLVFLVPTLFVVLFAPIVVALVGGPSPSRDEEAPPETYERDWTAEEAAKHGRRTAPAGPPVTLEERP